MADCDGYEAVEVLFIPLVEYCGKLSIIRL